MQREYSADVESRLRRLERSLAWSRVSLAVAALGFLVLLTTGQRTATKTVEAEKFVLKKNGTYYGELGFTRAGIPVLVLAPGNARAIEQLPDSRAGFYVSGHDGFAALQLGDDGGANLQVGTPALMSVVSEGRCDLRRHASSTNRR
jgi:hypothetical protein